MTAVFQQNAAEVASETFDDGLVSINFLTGRYYTMNGAGELIWSLLRAESTAASLATALAERAGIDYATALNDIGAFLDGLKSERMILVHDGELNPEARIEAVSLPVAIPYEAPKLQVFDDLADLILLDPIHDVNEMIGWPVARTEPTGI